MTAFRGVRGAFPGSYGSLVPLGPLGPLRLLGNLGFPLPDLRRLFRRPNPILLVGNIVGLRKMALSCNKLLGDYVNRSLQYLRYIKYLEAREVNGQGRTKI